MADIQLVAYSASRNAIDTAINFGELGAVFSVSLLSDVVFRGVDGPLSAGASSAVSVVVDGDDQGLISNLEFRTLSFESQTGREEQLVAIVDRSNVANAIIIPVDQVVDQNTVFLPTGTPFMIGEPETLSANITLVSNDTPSPFVAEDQVELDEDSSILIDVLQNDGGQALNILSVDAAVNGGVILENGLVRYTPDLNFSGQDRFSYSVIDEIGRIASGDVTINVNSINDTPVLLGGSFFSLPSGLRGVFNFDATDVEDEEGAGLLFDVTGGVDAEQFVVNPSTGLLAFETVPDPALPSDEDGDNVYEVIVRVSDSDGASDARLISVSLQGEDREEPPSFLGPDSEDVVVLENTTQVIDLTAVDDRDGEGANLVFSISGGADQDQFLIDQESGVLSFRESPDFESPSDLNGDGVFEVMVSVVDSDGLTDEKSITVEVQNDVGGDATEGQDTLEGTASRDRIDGLGGRDRISGFQDRDTLLGGDGNDVLRGGLDNDNLRGGDGDDVVRGQNGADRMFGNLGNDTLVGSIGEDTLKGNAGEDRLTGGGASDRLFGGTGDDTLIGSAGDDRLLGGAGDDLLAGGTGIDRFIFRQNAGDDIVQDFQDGVEQMRIQNGAESFADLTVTQIGTDVRIVFTGSSITLRNFEVDDLSAADFLF